MIIFNLYCDNQHQFEGWFKNETEYARQLSSGILRCPCCDSADVSKQMSSESLIKSFNLQLHENASTSKLTDIEKQTIIEQLGVFLDETMETESDGTNDFTGFKFELISSEDEYATTADELHDETISLSDQIPKKLLQ